MAVTIVENINDDKKQSFSVCLENRPISKIMMTLIKGIIMLVPDVVGSIKSKLNESRW